MELLTSILSKDFIDLAPPDASAPEEGVSASDVCLHGLNLIMPLMSAELLKFPSLSLQYFKTITLVCELYPDKICNLNPELQKNLIASLELGKILFSNFSCRLLNPNNFFQFELQFL